ncbi:hypothetical protein NDU88_005257 [Pleurodeles waltl]|uniref:Uncharacterized protein n=1 Tax=Pleurodeles waltl TaxID=8319 RepID=A0AAV7M8S9_PLEWA|nr:hypothetical protein NDU88_005257 [Pleurodeles waltl]
MLSGKATDKPSGKPAQQLFFSGALQLNKPASSLKQPQNMTGSEQVTTIHCILQEITAVSCRLEGMDTAITSLIMETKSIRSEIAGFQSGVTGLEHRMATMEDHVHKVLDKDQELLFFRSKLTDLED